MSDTLIQLHPNANRHGEETRPVGKWLIPGTPLSSEALASYYNTNAINLREGFDANDWMEPEQMYNQFRFLVDRADLNGKSLLDVGAGNGMFIEFLNANNIVPEQITAIDIASEQIAVLRNRFPTVNAIADDFFKYEFEESYDIIAMFGVAPCLKFIFPYLTACSALLRLLDRALRYAREGISFSFLNKNAYERAEEEQYEYLYFYPEEVCTLLSGARYEISTQNDLVTNVFLHSEDASGEPFRFNLNRIDDVLKLLK